MIQTDKTENPAVPLRPSAGVSPRPQGIAPWAVLLGLVLYAAVLWTHMGAYAAGPDQSGYLNSAKLLGQGTTQMKQRVISGANIANPAVDTYVPEGMRSAGSVAGQRMTPVYSAGLPLLIACAAKIVGWDAAPHATMFILSLAGILAMAWLAHEWGLNGAWMWMAALMLAWCPLYLCFSLQLMSDVPALVFATLAVVPAWKSRARRPWALAAGAGLACAVLVRPNNALIILPVAVCLGIDWRRWALLGAGGLPGAVFFCLYNRFNYGNAFSTGYGHDLDFLFNAKYLPPTLLHYLIWLPALLSPAGLLFPFLPFLIRRDPRKALVLIVWISSILTFYACYGVTHETWWELRFLLPAFPPMMVGSLWVLASWLQTNRAAKLRERLVVFLSRPFPPVTAIAAWITAAAASLYLLYDNRHTHPWYIHYSYPLFPVALAGAFQYMRTRLKAGPATQLRLAGMTLLVCIICLSDRHWTGEEGVMEIRRDGLMYFNICAWANEHLPANSVVFAMQTSGAVLCDTPFAVVRYDRVDHSQQQEIERACAATGRPVYAALHAYEAEKEIKRHGLTGTWVPEKTVDLITIWRLDSAGSALTPQ